MKINPQEMVDVIKKKLVDFDYEQELDEIGYVLSLGDGIVHISGLDNVRSNELVRFDNGNYGVVFNIMQDHVDVVVLGEDSGILQNQVVKRMGTGVSVPVGMELLGRVVNALGQPIDGGIDIANKEKYLVERKSPGITHRKSVERPLYTGVKMIDSLIPIGCGQRELILGDRQTGKTSIAIDTILNQAQINRVSPKKERVYCIYVSIGQKQSDVSRIVHLLRERRAMEYTIIVSATASSPAAMQYIAPYAGCAIGEFFRDNGMHAVIFFDDLTKHAISYRQMSLLLRRPAGREAYPGDVFYLHSRLLERAAQLSDALGGGSLTALPIVQTQEGDISAFIPTNIISITDGQIFLETGFFNKGIRPAINCGLSVSRVGSAAQTPLVTSLTKSIKMDLAQANELSSFSQFMDTLDQDTKDVIFRGYKLVEFMKQPRFSPLSYPYQVCLYYILKCKFLDKIDISKIGVVENVIIERLQPSDPLYIKLQSAVNVDDEILSELDSFITKVCDIVVKVEQVDG